MPRILFLLAAATALSACASGQQPRPDYDPWEGFNRKIFWFNDEADIYVLEPVAKGWERVVPEPLQRGLVNFFNNVRFPIVFVNDLLQGKPRDAFFSVVRVQANLFWGAGGLFDVASAAGIPRQDEDTGQTLGKWGIAPGPYLVLPFFGPSNPRDTAGLIGDAGLGFYTYFVTIPGATVGASVIDVINRRARVLDDVQNVKAASLDYYVFLRNAYAQRRYRLIHDQRRAGGAEEDNLYNEDLYNEDLYDFEEDQP